MTKSIITGLILLTLASSASAKPSKAEFQVAFIQAGHLIHYDYKLSRKAATELAEAMNELKQDGGAKHFVVVLEASK